MRKQIAILALALLSVASANLADAALFGRRSAPKSAADCICVLPTKTVHNSPYARYQPPMIAGQSQPVPVINQNDLLALQDTINDLNRQVDAMELQAKQAKRVKAIPVSHPAKPKIESLKGPGHLHNTAEDVYLVLLLPKNYQSCYPCMKLKSELESPSDASLKEAVRGTRYKYYVEGDALYKQQNWGARNPEVAQGKTVILAVQGNRVILKYVAPEPSGLGDKLIGKLRDKFCPKICPDCPKPEPEPEPEPEPVDPIPPTVEPIPPTVEPIPETPVGDVNKPVVMMLLGLVAAAVYGVFWRHRTR